MKKEVFDPEKLFLLLEGKHWNEFLSLLYRNKKDISQNQVALQAKSLFIGEFIKHVESSDPIIFKEVLDLLLLMNSEKHFDLNERDLHKIVTFYLEALKNTNEEKAVKFALRWKRFDNVDKYLQEVLAKQPLYVSHSNYDSIQVTKNKNVEQINHTISLFKSPLEYDFFCAVKENFPNYHTYPNVALSCIIEYDKIKDELNDKQRDYFLKSIVDCVVYDPDDSYKPKYFFELDSTYHDNEESRIKDSWKDLFFSKAGVKLYRIRAKNKNANKESYLALIKELFY
ncbi:MAG: DUF2726 domain-containing protein [Bacteroidetes bacterium]|nr:DUF2726 domain-containing protein [Bacteroidota bacterium]MBU1679441.1 DUF2726 domain-containing protein [Bacteroidota bacterium]